MKLHKIAAVLVLAIALPLATVVSPAVADDLPNAPITLTGPATGTTVATGKPTFVWAAVAGAELYALRVNSSSKTDAAGQLLTSDKYYVDGESITAPKSSFASKYTFVPGTYYWQVSTNAYGATSNVNQPYLSAVAKFVVLPRFVLTKFKAKISTNPADSLNEVELNGRLACNLTDSNSPMRIAMKVFTGTKKVGSQTREAGFCTGTKSTKQFLNFQPRPGAIKKGSKLTVEILASHGKAKSALTTVKVTWK